MSTQSSLQIKPFLAAVLRGDMSAGFFAAPLPARQENIIRNINYFKVNNVADISGEIPCACADLVDNFQLASPVGGKKKKSNRSLTCS